MTFSNLTNLFRWAMLFSLGGIITLLSLLGFNNLCEKIYIHFSNVWPEQKCYFYSHLGWIFECKDEIDKAIYYFREASLIEPRNPMYYWDIGILYEKKRNVDVAILFYDKALNIGSDLSVDFKNELQSKIDKLRENNNRKGSVD